MNSPTASVFSDYNEGCLGYPIKAIGSGERPDWLEWLKRPSGACLMNPLMRTVIQHSGAKAQLLVLFYAAAEAATHKAGLADGSPLLISSLKQCAPVAAWRRGCSLPL